MKAMQLLSTAFVAACFFFHSYAADVDPIVIKGKHFFYKTNGTEFFIKGLAYQSNTPSDSGQSYVDPLTDVAGCRRDIPYLRELSTNVIRVYAIDPDGDHSECMQMLADAGIYVFADLSEPSQSIVRSHPQWNIELYTRYTSVVDALAKYTNVIGFFAGNEVTNNMSYTPASAFVKAAVRDTKSYIYEKGYREIPVGYAADDDAELRGIITQYFDCGTDAERVDFWGLNIYEWCGNSSFQSSGYADRTKEFEAFNIPAFFSEYGCNTIRPREFKEAEALFGPQMTKVWSGGIVYMFQQEDNNYGVVSIEGDTIHTLTDFPYLSSQMAKAKPTGTNMAQYTPTVTANAACPTVNTTWQAGTVLPPTPNKELCSCMAESVTCRPKAGLSGKDVGNLLGIVCGLSEKACTGISGNAATGTFGSFSMCDADDQLAWALNAYYLEQKKAGNGASACDFKGSATSGSAQKPTGTCAALLSAAGSFGTGTVTDEETGSGRSKPSKGVAASSMYASQTITIPSVAQIGLYLLCAFGAGMGMVLM
ncbi:CAZyme family GH72 and CBM43 [Paecilomyces variotii]|nr:CAZyme family GH72 and CBM43 [Paecilomyces variotii]KAJ9274286.1 CAZyme family GH72 and CBM43 [Paecilomyces variotii]KAJ9339975.1 CAZyme family GH72 and CBM43 [Paecilomyces variotii]KAJ9379945.1 CAZyme family GH72 and CBM43 [Paecilomyces variotii]